MRYHVSILMILFGCVTPAKQKGKAPEVKSEPAAEVGEEKPKTDVVSVPVPVNCFRLGKLGSGEPLFFKSEGFVLTSATKKCDLADGTKGVSAESDFIAMGFPCTGGEGRIDWKDKNYLKPKMVSFLLETNCKVQPNDWATIQAAIAREGGFNPTGKLLAVNPFVVQYWSLTGYDDADTSMTVELRTAKTLNDAWSRFSTKGESLRVRVVGRENAWNQNDLLYEVDLELFWVSKNRFRSKVSEARTLAAQDIQKIKIECEALKPKRDCTVLP